MSETKSKSLNSLLSPKTLGSQPVSSRMTPVNAGSANAASVNTGLANAGIAEEEVISDSYEGPYGISCDGKRVPSHWLDVLGRIMPPH